MSGRSYSVDEYRYGFNGKENDASYGDQLIQDYGFRLYNPAIGKFLSVDPLAPDYPILTPYQFASNTPISAIDVEGLEGMVIINRYDAGGMRSKNVMTARDIDGTVNFGATGNNIRSLGNRDILEINLGNLPNGTNPFNIRTNAVPSRLNDDERSIISAGIDVWTVLTDRMPPDPTLANPPPSDNLNAVGGFTFPGATPNGNGNVTVLERIGNYADVPIIDNVTISTRYIWNKYFKRFR